jgi:TrmH family RNA methyltransferase
MSASVKAIRSRDNPQVKALMRLASSSRERRRTGRTLLEGDHLVRAFRDSGGAADTVMASESAFERNDVRELIERTPALARYVFADELLDRISQLVSASGVAAVIRTPRQRPLPALSSDCVVLENIQDPGNLGSILRTAVAAMVSHVFLSRGSVFAWAPKVVRAGMGAHFFLSIYEGVSLGEITRNFSGMVVALEPRAVEPLYALDLTGPVAWLLGNEGAGLSEDALQIATRRARVPMPGKAESLNVAATAAVCLFEQLRQRQQK